MIEIVIFFGKLKFNGDHNHYYEKINCGKDTDISEEIFFDAPDNWKFIRLRDIAVINSGGTPAREKKEYWQNGDIPWLKISDITSSKKYVTHASEYITTSGLNNSSAKIMKLGTILYTIFATIGEVGILGIDASCNQAIAGIQPIDDCLTDYLFYFLKYMRVYMGKISRGIAQNNINLSILQNSVVPLPPLAEQQRIVEKIESLFAEIDKIEKAQNELDKLKEQTRQKVLDLAVRGKLVKQDPNDEPASILLEKIEKEKKQLIKEGKIKKDKNESIIYRGDDKNYYEKIGNTITNITDEIPFEIPEVWTFCKIDNLAYMISSRKHQIKETDILKTGSIPVISQGKQMVEGYTNESSKIIKLEGPIIVFGDHTRIVKYINFDFVVGADGTKLISPISVNGMWLYFTIEWMAAQINDRGYARHFTLLVKQFVPLPPLAEQQRIVEKTELLFSLL